MPDTSELLRQFKREKYWLSGLVPYRFWGGVRLETWIDFEDKSQPTDRQFQVFSALVEHGEDIRTYFERTLFEHYQEEVYGSMAHFSPEKGFYGADEITPPIKSSNEIWRLIDEPAVSIPGAYVEVPQCKVWFELMFSCCWDEEHGLQVEFQDWKITYIGPQG